MAETMVLSSLSVKTTSTIIYIYKMKLAAKHGKNNGFEPVFCGNSIKINGNQPPDFQNNFKIRST
jgi:hypothetical protein